jgi:hypothetical protein
MSHTNPVASWGVAFRGRRLPPLPPRANEGEQRSTPSETSVSAEEVPQLAVAWLFARCRHLCVVSLVSHPPARTLGPAIRETTPFEPMAAASVCKIWFRLEGTAPDKVHIETSSDIADLRDAIYAKVKAKLEPRGVIASDLVLSTADRDGKTYDDEEARVPTVHQTKKEALIVTGTFVRAARSLFAAAVYGPRSSSGHAWKRSCRSGYWPAGGVFVCAWRRGFRRRLAVYCIGPCRANHMREVPLGVPPGSLRKSSLP